MFTGSKRLADIGVICGDGIVLKMLKGPWLSFIFSVIVHLPWDFDSY
mgnify:CR=1 FL=1